MRETLLPEAAGLAQGQGPREEMSDLQIAIRFVAIIIAAVAAMIVGDYLGYKVGRMKVVWTSLSIALLSVVVFAVYAAVVLLA